MEKINVVYFTEVRGDFGFELGFVVSIEKLLFRMYIL